MNQTQSIDYRLKHWGRAFWVNLHTQGWRSPETVYAAAQFLKARQGDVLGHWLATRIRHGADWHSLECSVR